MLGQTVLHYEILEKLGAGGMGEVYKAQDKRLNRLVAIKVLLGSGSSIPEYRRRFVQEAQAASSLNHPNIITIHDIFSQGVDQFMVMEYINGKTLADLIPQEGLGQKVSLQYALQIADGLRAAHSVGIVHRDLKPGNVMVSTWGLVKILDFGLAKVTTPEEDVSLNAMTKTAAPSQLTMEGSILGTYSYMSPEQAQGGKVDARSDIFSLGCVLYEMISGRKAFCESSPLLTLTAVLRDNPPPAGDPVLQPVIERALRKDPAQRFQSMQEMYDALTNLKQQLDSGVSMRPVTSSTVTMTGAAAATPARRPMIFIGAALIAFLILAAAGGWWWMSRPKSGHYQMTAAEPAGSTAPKPSAFAPPAKAASAAVAPTPAPPQTRTVQVTGGTSFGILLAEDVAPDCEAGQRLSFHTSTAVTVDGTVVIANGALVTGAIVEPSKRKFLVHTTRPTFRLFEVTAVNGTKIKVRATPDESRKAPALDPIGGIKSKDAVAPAGSRFWAYIDGDQTLTLAK